MKYIFFSIFIFYFLSVQSQKSDFVLKRFIYHQESFEMYVPNSWVEYDRKENIHTFFESKKWKGYFSVSTLYMPHANQDSFINGFLAGNSTVQNINIGNKSTLFFKEQSNELPQGNEIYYWYFFDKNLLYICKFVADSDKVRAISLSKELLKIQEVISSIKTINSNLMIAIPKLQKNDQVALISPAGFLDDELSALAAEKWLESIGLKGVRGKNILEKKGVFAGSDKQRLADFQAALDNPDIKAIWALRGGYGAMRIMNKLDFTQFDKNPKWLIGFSDITAFHNQFVNMGYECVHGIMPIQLINESPERKKGLESLKNVLYGEPLNYEIPNSKYNRNGSGKGVLVGGNLSLLQSLLGTQYQLNTDGKILFIEEVGEAPYRIDRLLQSLKLAGAFENLEGLIIGGFTSIEESDSPFGKNYQQMILEITKGKKYPILFEFPAGHIKDNRALILGREVELKVSEDKGTLKF